MTEEALKYIENHADEAYELLLELARIPAPSGKEEKRARFCLDWLKARGAEGVFIDEVNNVIYPVGCEGEGAIDVYMAHSDVVFPDEDELPLRVEEGRIYCPGIGDDTANAVALLMVMKYIAEHRGSAPEGLLLVINSGEEGLGNLRGSRAVMERYGSRVREFVTFDGYAKGICTRAVGSRRFEVEIATEGGHSWGNFGNRNAIACLSALIADLYTAPLPEEGKTTFNVGLIEGGTSVNTIAERAKMLYEFRSDRAENLDAMQAFFDSVTDAYRAEGLDVRVRLLGERPCSAHVDEQRMQALIDRASAAVEHAFGFVPKAHAGSTDCNIPLSLGTPAVCVSCILGGGAHTRGEYVKTDSLAPGLHVAFEMILKEK